MLTPRRTHLRIALALTLSVPLIVAHAQSSDDTTVIWTDAVRLPTFQLYQKTFPNAKVRIEVLNAADYPSKIQLLNRGGGPWPDVVWTGEPQQTALLSQPNVAFTADLTPYVSKSTLTKFPQGSLNACQVNGKLYCLRTSLGQSVLWYDSVLMKQFGYKVPTTWEQYQALGLRVAKEHPGYLVGNIGMPETLQIFLLAGNCQLTTPVAGTEDQIRTNATSAQCTRVTKMLDTLNTAGVLARANPWESVTVKAVTDKKVLMIPAPSWFSQVYKETYSYPDGRLAAAAPLRWANETTAATMDWGGGAVFVSSHSKNIKAAIAVALWAATDTKHLSQEQVFPAYRPAADLWSKQAAGNKFFVRDPSFVLRSAAARISPAQGYLRITANDSLAKIVMPAVKSGGSITDTLAALQKDIENAAELVGYSTVK